MQVDENKKEVMFLSFLLTLFYDVDCRTCTQTNLIPAWFDKKNILLYFFLSFVNMTNYINNRLF